MIALRWLMLAIVPAWTIACAQSTSAQCTVTPPEGWSPRAVRWEGDCAGGYAEGLGVLKEQDGRTVKRLFFGRVKQGELQLGVIELPEDGYRAGRFEHGRIVPSDDRQTFIEAFDTGASAASAAAQHFSRKGNAASSRFYEAKAKALREQMD